MSSSPVLSKRREYVPTNGRQTNGRHTSIRPIGYVTVQDQEEVAPPLFSGRVSSRKSGRLSNEDRSQSLAVLLTDFCNRTSSHGIPFFRGESYFGRYVWVVIFFCCFGVFLVQTFLTMSDYLMYRTIIEMQLKFEAAPFPAATICNLNAFKHSMLKGEGDISEALNIWEKALMGLHGKSPDMVGLYSDGVARDGWEGRPRQVHTRVKRHAIYQPIFVRCTCVYPHDQCVPQRNPLQTNVSVCVCFEDSSTGDIWPCYPTGVWSVKSCSQCSLSRTCVDPEHPNASLPLGEKKQCLCQSVSHYCVLHASDDIPWWNPNNYTIYPMWPVSVPDQEIVDAYGLEHLKDKGALTTRMKENLIFLVAEKDKDVRHNMSYTLNEFVLRCSFNSKDCNMKDDFQLHMDPEYGNCYTFNFNGTVSMDNVRAGPMYGLRLLLNVNQSDYMPTTEAAGVRIVVHEQNQEPFPDTFGYSAPTGFVSSFGLKTKQLSRLSEPYGRCSDNYRPEGYIYQEKYSREGCSRSGFQHEVIRACGCGDPRFPVPPDTEFKPCNGKSNKDRSCLANVTNMYGGRKDDQKLCPQPCEENVFETAYSAAAWPALNFKIGSDCLNLVNDAFNDTAACTEYYRVNTAYIEIYYEQLNFEMMAEKAGYTLVNLFSDFGGNIGLWIGFSVITVAELTELLLEVCTYMLYHKPRRLRMRLKQKQEEQRKKRGITGIMHQINSFKQHEPIKEKENDVD